jgi:hypothetical protein
MLFPAGLGKANHGSFRPGNPAPLLLSQNSRGPYSGARRLLGLPATGLGAPERFTGSELKQTRWLITDAMVPA